MPNANRSQTFYNPTGDPDTMNVATLYNTGQIGQAYDVNDRAYQCVQLDSGATSSTPAGAVAANQLAYWKNRATYTVTNDSRFALLDGQANSFRNNVAGIFRAAVTAGYYCNVLQEGRAISVKEVGSATGGMTLIASTSTTAADALGVAINTAPNCIPIGVVRTATSGTTCTADIMIPNIP